MRRPASPRAAPGPQPPARARLRPPAGAPVIAEYPKSLLADDLFVARFTTERQGQDVAHRERAGMSRRRRSYRSFAATTASTTAGGTVCVRKPNAKRSAAYNRKTRSRAGIHPLTWLLGSATSAGNGRTCVSARACARTRW